MEADKRNKTKGKQEKGGTKIIHVHGSDTTEATTSSQAQQHPAKKRDYRIDETQWKTQHEQEIVEQEEQWQTQKRKQNKNQEQLNPKTAWRHVSHQHKGTKDNRQKEQTSSGPTRHSQCSRGP
ncbi:hypothetical protein KY289_013274 [Solanum tuberosum]|nr:hypothetical protein KY289_013274 [Solanum tuberosum]